MKIVNNVDWEIDPARSALLLHDLEGEELAPLGGRERKRILAEAERLARLCAARGVPVFASRMPPARREGEAGLLYDIWARRRAPAASSEAGDGEPAPALRLDGLPVTRLEKRSYSAFYASELEVSLRRLGRDSLLIAGIHTSIGCLSTAIDAFMRDIRPFMLADAMADLSPEEHEAGLKKAAQTCARIARTAELEAALRQRRPPQVSFAFDVC
ncbi:isochorismatase family protein [Afifella pfennigii]|uniref:isochorismatase family protein n=1 Tax=Afifella pfennigii TaxID=209897 RepID=UPI00068C44D8|nr:isochorismatase family protein [Afifella pfennigii]